MGAVGCTGDSDSDVPTNPGTPQTPGSYAAAVDGARYQADLEGLEGVRAPGTPGWTDARERCRSTFEDLGLQVEEHSFSANGLDGVNVLGRMPGSDNAGTVVISAHYDGVPDCPAADDNGSGVAGVLEAARVLADGAFTHDLLFACWDLEEDGLLGSEAWVLDNAGAEPVAMMWSLEMIGYASDEPGSQQLPFGFDLAFPDQAESIAANDDRGDFIAWIGSEDAAGALDAFESQAAADGLPVETISLTSAQTSSPLFADFQRSDHASFWAAGIPAVMLTDTANFRNTHYHCADGPDTADRLDQAFATKTIAALVETTAMLAVIE